MMTTSAVLSSSSSSSSRVSGLLLQRFNVAFGGRSLSVVAGGGTSTASSSNANIMTTPSSSSKLNGTFRANSIKSTTRTTHPCFLLDHSSLTFLTPSVAHDHSARDSEMGFPSMPSSFPTPSSLLLPASDQNHNDNTINISNTVLEMMNRNARKPKRANHGARPCSRSSRRKKKDEVGKRRRG
mmetsp:Transcript_16686/g.40527  ORF Transcript_16686/g.40527 Transcript_16686/m.40527 type:complete len:183 (-) Transcript_16686:450-998(-)